MILKRHSEIVINAKTREAGVSIKITNKIYFVAKAWEDTNTLKSEYSV